MKIEIDLNKLDIDQIIVAELYRQYNVLKELSQSLPDSRDKKDLKALKRVIRYNTLVDDYKDMKF